MDAVIEPEIYQFPRCHLVLQCGGIQLCQCVGTSASYKHKTQPKHTVHSLDAALSILLSSVALLALWYSNPPSFTWYNIHYRTDSGLGLPSVYPPTEFPESQRFPEGAFCTPFIAQCNMQHHPSNIESSQLNISSNHLFVPRELDCVEVPHIARAKCSIWWLRWFFLRIFKLIYQFLRAFRPEIFHTGCEIYSDLCHHLLFGHRKPERQKWASTNHHRHDLHCHQCCSGQEHLDIGQISTLNR